MAIHEKLTRIPKHDLQQVGWSKATELVKEKAIETAGLMLGNDNSRGYCLEMIAADFLAGANVEENGS
jgi:hypothetical protein